MIIWRKQIREATLRLIGAFKRPSPGIHILNAHFITPEKRLDSHALIFEDFLKFLRAKTNFLRFEEAIGIIQQNEISPTEPYVAFSYDDGYEECYSLIAPILETFGCNAAFFINANYINSNKEYQNAFNERVHQYQKEPMSWTQIKSLYERGHLIGSHTLDHYCLATLSESDIEKQIRANKEILEGKLGYSCDHFAWPYGQMKHINNLALDVGRKYHRFIYSATNYKKYFSYGNTVINRRQIESYWPKSHINYFLSVRKRYNEGPN